MSADKVNLLLPQIQLVARVDCDSIECDVEILEHNFRSLNLFDVQNQKFYITFDAKLKITLYISGREESIVITAEEFEVSSVDVIGDSIYDFDFDEATIGRDELYQRLKGGDVDIRFYTLTN